MAGIEQKYCRSGKDGCFFDRNVPALQACSYVAYFSVIHVHTSALHWQQNQKLSVIAAIMLSPLFLQNRNQISRI